MTSRGPEQTPKSQALFAALFFLALTVLLTWPQARHMTDALSDFGDAKLNARILQWDFAQTLRDPRQLFQLDFFHPARYVLAFSENLYGVALLGFPILALGGSALLNYNALLLAGMFLSALAAWALAREITGDPLAATVAGVVYAFLPWRMEQIPHLQHQWGAFLCLVLLFLIRYVEAGRRRDLVLFAAAFAWNALANVHFAIFSGFLVGAGLVWAWLRAGPARGRRIAAVACATALAAVPFLPFALGYRAAQKLYGFQRYLGEVQTFSGRWTDFLSVGERNRFWGASLARWSAPEGHFFPGALAAVLAIAALVVLWRRRRPESLASLQEPAARWRLVLARGVDVALALGAIAWILSLASPGLTIGPLRLRDPGRVLVVLLVLLIVRLATRLPGGAGDLRGMLRRLGLDPRVSLLALIAATGVLVAMGANTPFYRFLVQSFGDVFRAIRAPSRGIVLFHLAVAVLAAWGMALLTGHRRRATRRLAVGGALAVLVLEYRAFPLPMIPTPAEAPPVYRWMKKAEFPGAVAEWPLGFLYDFDYVFRQAAHEKPLINGYSGFFPAPYDELQAALKKRPIDGAVWGMMGRLGTSLLVYHSHEARGIEVMAYADALEKALASGGLEVVRSFPHGDGRDFVFVASGTRWKAAVAGGSSESETLALLSATVLQQRREIARLTPPMGGIHLPAERQVVAPGFWGFGWALDDSGIAEIRVSTELGPAGVAALGGKWPGLEKVYPDHPDSRHGGFGFVVPLLPAGPHELRLEVIAKDGGRTEFRRRIVIE